MKIATLEETTFQAIADRYRGTVALVSGYINALDYDADLADEDIRQVVVHNDDIAALLAEPGGVQKEALALVYAVAGVEV